MKTTQIQLSEVPSVGGTTQMEKVIRSLPEVKDVKVEPEARRVTVVHESGDEMKLVAAVRAIGMPCEIIPDDAEVLAPPVPRMDAGSDMGSLCLLSISASWIALLWLGWWLLFTAHPASIVHSSTGAVASATERVYFIGFTLFTLGNGDFVPTGRTLAGGDGAGLIERPLFVTLSITYLTPVLSATMDKRQLAAVIHDLGVTPTEIVANSWDGEGFDDLMSQLSLSIGPKLHLHAERHLAYPVLHYFHSRDPEHLALAEPRQPG